MQDMRSVGIMAYGTPEDRLKLEAISKLAGQSGSEWLIAQIRKTYEEVYGKAPASQVVVERK